MRSGLSAQQSDLVRGKVASSLSWEVQASLATVSRPAITVRPGWRWSRQMCSQKEKLNMIILSTSGLR